MECASFWMPFPSWSRRVPGVRVFLVGRRRVAGGGGQKGGRPEPGIRFPAVIATGRVHGDGTGLLGRRRGGGKRGPLRAGGHWPAGSPLCRWGLPVSRGYSRRRTSRTSPTTTSTRGGSSTAAPARIPRPWPRRWPRSSGTRRGARALGEFGREFVVRRLGIEAGLARLEEIYLATERRGFLQRIRDGYEFGRSYLSFTRYRARREDAPAPLPPTPGPAPAPGRSPGKEKGFLRNSATTFLTTIFCLGVGTVQAAVVARVLNPEGKGGYTAAMLLPQLFRHFPAPRNASGRPPTTWGGRTYRPRGRCSGR